MLLFFFSLQFYKLDLYEVKIEEYILNNSGKIHYQYIGLKNYTKDNVHKNKASLFNLRLKLILSALV